MTISANDAHPYPIYNARFRLIVPLLDADGDPVSPSSPDTELSQDCGTFADATNEFTEIATSSGVGYIDLIATEMDTKSTVVRFQSTGAKTTIAVLNPRRLPVIRTGTAQAGAASTITLDSGASAVDNFYAGCWVNITNDSPSNALGQCRMIVSYVGSTKVATVGSAWGTNPSSASTFEILQTEWSLFASADVQSWRGALPNVLVSGRVDDSVGAMAASVLTAAAIASDAITAAKIADGSIDAATFAAGAINAAAIATDAITAAKVAADVTTEIQSGLATAAAVAALNNLSAAQVNAEVDTAIADARLDELLAADSDIDGAAPPTVGSVFHELMSSATGSFVYTQVTDSLNALRSQLASGAAVQAIDDFLDIEVPIIEADLDNIQTRLPAALVSGRMDSSVGAMAANTLTASALATDAVNEIVDQVWDEATSGHQSAGSTGLALTDAGGAGTPPTAAAIADAVWDELKAGHTVADSFGDYLDDEITSRASQASVDTIDDFLDTEVAALQADTDDIQARLPAALVSGRIDASVGAMAAGVVTATAVATGAIDADALATDAVNEIVDQVWEEATADHQTAGTTGKALTDAGGAGTLPSVADIADGVWDEARAGHVAAGSFGQGVASVQGNVTGSAASVTGAVGSVTAGVTVTTNNDKTGYALAVTPPTAAQIRTEMDSNSVDLDAIIAATGVIDDFLDTEIAAIKAKTDNLPASPAAVSDIPTVGAIADQVWDEATSGHQGAGTTGKALTDAGAAGTPPPTVGAIADAVWDEATSGHQTVGTTGKALTNAGSGGGGGGATAAEVWAYGTRTLTQSAAQVAAALAGSMLNMRRGDRFNASITGIGSLTGFEKLRLTAKRSKNDPDSAAVWQLLLSNPVDPDDGLQVLGGAPTDENQWASLTVVDEAAGDVDIVILEDATTLLSQENGLIYDWERWDAATGPHTLAEGRADVSLDITRTTG